ncbi:hypothetical protein OEZ86_004800 [Tetradesmus obliquus]|nr:hypothetical protein OEZ86_004800 [Tetradesmus obliquus]
MVYKAALLVAAAAAAVAALTTLRRDTTVMTAAVAPLVQLLKPASNAANSLANSTTAPQRQRWVQQISWEPRSYLFHGFLSDEEVAQIKTAAAPFMKRSTVVGDAKQHINVVDEYRTSYGMFIRRNNPLITGFMKRVAEWAKLPVSHFEDMQVLRYGAGQQYRPHQDSILDEVQQPHGPRLATVLLYLNDVPEGGETAFPDTDASKWASPEVGAQVDPTLSECAKGSVAYRPQKGDAFMFWSFKPDGVSMDPFAQHTGCPPTKGVKWAAPMWIHSRPFRPDTANAPHDPVEAVDPGVCEDVNPQCEQWAASGACETNKAYMAGNVEHHGHCRKACGVCSVCETDDRICYEENRRKQGYLVYTEDDELAVEFEEGRPVVREKQAAGRQGGCAAAGAACA